MPYIAGVDNRIQPMMERLEQDEESLRQLWQDVNCADGDEERINLLDNELYEALYAVGEAIEHVRRVM